MTPTSHAPQRFCPQCRVTLSVHREGQVELDVCRACGGAFFDPGEATAVLGPEADPERWGRDPGAQPPHPNAAWCPAGHGPMWRLPTAPAPDAPAVHACGHCRGAWIDQATVAALRAQPPPEAPTGGRMGVGQYVFQLVSLMPVEVSNPVSRKPWLTWGLAASLVLAFAAARLLPGDGAQRVASLFAVIPSEIRSGYGLLTPLTYFWLHLGVMHLVGNLYFFLVFGDNVEDRFGRGRYLALLGAAAVVGALVEVAARPQSVSGVGGASGGVAGVLGAYMVLFPRTKLSLVLMFVPLKVPAAAYFAFWALLQVYGYVTRQPGVAWLAHLGGLAVGVVAAAFVRARQPALARAS